MNFHDLKNSLLLKTLYILFILQHSLKQNFFSLGRIKFDRIRIIILLIVCKNSMLKFTKFEQYINGE